MNPQSQEQLYDSNSTNSNQVSNNQQIYEEKPFYLTNQKEELKSEQIEEELNSKQSIFDDCKFRCNIISLFFLYNGIINALTFAFSLIFLGIFQGTDKFKEDYVAIIGIIGAIGSLICVIIFVLLCFKYSWIEPKTCKILLGVFAVFWISFVGCFCIKIQGTVYLTLAIIMSSDFVICIITMKWKHYLDERALRVFGDIVIIVIGCLLFVAFGGEFENDSKFNFFFLVFWVIMRAIVFSVLVEGFNSDTDNNIPYFVIKYYALWFIFLIVMVFAVIWMKIDPDYDY